MLASPSTRRRAWRVAVLAVVLAGLWLLKRHYARSSLDGLVFVLSPTATLVTLLTGVRFEMETGVGYLSHDRLFAIAAPCAGINFMIAAWALLAFLLSCRSRDLATSVEVIALSLAIAYAATVVVNATRIALALSLAAHPIASDFWTAGRAHRVLGIVVYFGGLLLLQSAAVRAIASRRWSS
jgi:exosortase K